MPALSKREHIIDVAIGLFKQNGINSTGVDKIIAEAMVSKKTLYNHFATKDELVLASLRKDDAKGRQAIVKFVESASPCPKERLLAIFDFYSMWFTSSRFSGCFFINTASEVSMRNPELRRMCAEHKTLIENYIAKLAKSAGSSQPEHLAKQINILLEGATVYAYVVGDVEAIAHAKSLGKQIIDAELN